jgi:hypothetical protein
VTLWEEVDERVLRWVFALPPTWGREKLLDLPIKHPQPVDGLDGIDSRTLAESLRRLHGFGLVDGMNDEYHDGEGYGDGWDSLRVTALGLIYLGEWPDLDLVATASAIRHVLRAAAEQAPNDEDRNALVRAAGMVGRTADGVVRDTLAEVAHASGGEIADE